VDRERCTVSSDYCYLLFTVHPSVHLVVVYLKNPQQIEKSADNTIEGNIKNAFFFILRPKRSKYLDEAVKWKSGELVGVTMR